jgi:hypothetical protein
MKQCKMRPVGVNAIPNIHLGSDVQFLAAKKYDQYIMLCIYNFGTDINVSRTIKTDRGFSQHQAEVE